MGSIKYISLAFTESIFNEARPAPPPPLPNGLRASTPSHSLANTQPQNPSTNVMSANSGAFDPPMPPIASPSSPPSPLHQSQIVVSGNGNVYPITMFPLSRLHPDVYVKQMTAISKLEGLFPTERLKQHNFEWNMKLDEWLPLYDFWKPSPGVPPTVDQIWEEYTKGMGSPKSFSILELTANWGGRWKRNIQKIKTESSKRKKIVDLVQALSMQPSWDSTKALAFLQEKYPIPSSSSSQPFLKNISAFIAHLQMHKNALSDIVKSSS